MVRPHDLPDAVTSVVGRDRRTQLHRFITAMVETIAATGTVALRQPEADALAAFRSFNYERIYLRPEAVPPGRPGRPAHHRRSPTTYSPTRPVLVEGTARPARVAPRRWPPPSAT